MKVEGISMMKSTYIKNMLGTLGYSNEHFSENYSVQIDGTSAISFDYVAFSDRYMKDVSTSCIAVQEVMNDREEDKYVEGAKYLAAPIVIISKINHVRVWKVEPRKSTLLNDNEENIIHLYFEKNRFEFMSSHLIDVKMGCAQLSIFEAFGLIDFSREATCKILSEEFEKGLISAKKYLKKGKNIRSRDLNNITSITMHIIAALIINSKINSDEKVPDIWELLTCLSQKYKEYFDDKLMLKYGKELLDAIYENLNHSINYQSVEHELLGYFYESTLLQVSEAKAKTIRKEFGIYYTPRMLSQEIVLSIPFESISVDKRYVLDGTCGSGSLLLSACKRLENLVRYEKTEFDRHDYLTRMIEGNDIDKFASEVAKLSLLLYSLPYGNKWNIHNRDLLCMNEAEIQIPSVILGNPPYGEVRGNRQKTQRATAFLDKYLDWLQDDGFIGIILPESFLQNDSSILQREKLLKKFDIIELWMLPGQIFENNCSTAVVIAQKKKVQGENVTKVKVLDRNKKSVRNYLKRHQWDFEFFVNIQQSWMDNPKYKMSVSPVEDILQKITKAEKTIGDITKNVMGIMIPSNYEFSRNRFHGEISYIANAANFRKYVISKQMRDKVAFFNYHMSKGEEDKIIEDYDYKGLRLRREYEDIYAASNKILVKMSSTPGEMNCIQAFVDEDGYYPSHSFFVIISEDERISNYVLCALINSKLINAFVRKECVKRTLTTSVVRNVPVPNFSDIQITKIQQYYWDIKEAYTKGDECKAEEIQEKIDDIIFEAFGLNRKEQERIRVLFEVHTEMENNLISEKNEFKEYHYVSGQVEEIDSDSMCCDICTVEFGEQKIKMEETMPGWFLRKGAEFSAKYHEGKLFDIKPLMYTYLGDEEIIAILNGEISEGGVC